MKKTEQLSDEEKYPNRWCNFRRAYPELSDQLDRLDSQSSEPRVRLLKELDGLPVGSEGTLVDFLDEGESANDWIYIVLFDGASETSYMRHEEIEMIEKRCSSSNELPPVDDNTFDDNSLSEVPWPPEERHTDPVTGGQKGRKLEEYALIPPQPLAEVARVYGLGARKYSSRNWEKGYPFSWSYSALQRHVNAFWSGVDTDRESGLSHLAHAVFHCFAMMEWLRTHPEQDDRVKS